MDRNCEICRHHKESGCSKWECQFEPTDSRREVIEELENVKQGIRSLGNWVYDYEIPNSYMACIDVINKRIKELKA